MLAPTAPTHTRRAASMRVRRHTARTHTPASMPCVSDCAANLARSTPTCNICLQCMLSVAFASELRPPVAHPHDCVQHLPLLKQWRRPCVSNDCACMRLCNKTSWPQWKPQVYWLTDTMGATTGSLSRVPVVRSSTSSTRGAHLPSARPRELGGPTDVSVCFACEGACPRCGRSSLHACSVVCSRLTFQ